MDSYNAITSTGATAEMIAVFYKVLLDQAIDSNIALELTKQYIKSLFKPQQTS